MRNISVLLSFTGRRHAPSETAGGDWQDSTWPLNKSLNAYFGMWGASMSDQSVGYPCLCTRERLLYVGLAASNGLYRHMSDMLRVAMDHGKSA